MPRPQKGIVPTSCFFVSLVDFTSYRLIYQIACKMSRGLRLILGVGLSTLWRRFGYFRVPIFFFYVSISK